MEETYCKLRNIRNYLEPFFFYFLKVTLIYWSFLQHIVNQNHCQKDKYQTLIYMIIFLTKLKERMVNAFYMSRVYPVYMVYSTGTRLICHLLKYITYVLNSYSFLSPKYNLQVNLNNA